MAQGGEKVPQPVEVPMTGIATAVDDHGIVTVRTEDGQESQVYGKNWQVGDKVECRTRNRNVECQRL
jgi:hypothetical protein